MAWAKTNYGTKVADATIVGTHDLWFITLSTIPSWASRQVASPQLRYREMGWASFVVDGYATDPIPLEFPTQLLVSPSSKADALNIHLEVGVQVGVLGLTGAGLIVEGDLTVNQRLLMAAAVGKIVAGATSISFRNNADNADNLLVSDAGVVTARSTLNALAGVNVGTAVGAATGQVSASAFITPGTGTHKVACRNYVVANNGTKRLDTDAVNGPGLLVVEAAGDGVGIFALSLIGYITKIADPQGRWGITAGSGSPFNLYHGGSSVFWLENKAGGQVTFRLSYMGV